MQNVFLWSSLTYEWTHVTPSSALVPTTDRQACAPLSVIGISSPSGNTRSTMKRAIDNPPACYRGPQGPHHCQARFRSARGHPWKGSRRCSIRVLISFWCALRPPGGNPCCDLHPRIESQLVEDVMHMVVDCALGEKQPVRDLAVAQAAGEQLGDLVLPFAQRSGLRRPLDG